MSDPLVNLAIKLISLLGKEVIHEDYGTYGICKNLGCYTDCPVREQCFKSTKEIPVLNQKQMDKVMQEIPEHFI